mmetsp:Transcript_131350/g.185314  ORF Transcript_131350/g.185314 Transcript_131350/m.185314 type:complete len:99 (+) Transcript_131350:72-368(+)
MEDDNRGFAKRKNDHNKRHNKREEHERSYKVAARAQQSDKADTNYNIIDDDSTKFLQKKLNKEAKQRQGMEKNKMYEEEMDKCMPKPKGKHNKQDIME